MKLGKNEKGFTLVELLLVMAIIGILAGIIFVAISPARRRARMTNFKQVINSANTAAMQCVDSGGTIQPVGVSGSICSGGSASVNAIKLPGNIKNCKTGKAWTGTLQITNGNSETYNIKAGCSPGETDTCKAECTINGCKFTNC